MSKKILFSLMTLVLVVGMAGAGAFAYFSDTETSTGNTFTAGTLDIGIMKGPMSFADKAIVENMKPGDTVTFIFKVSNGGTLPLNYWISTEVTGDIIKPGVNDPFVSAINVGVAGAMGTYSAPESLLPGAFEFVHITVELPYNAGNYYQGKTGELTVTYYAEQLGGPGPP